MNYRWELIQLLINHYGLKSYLEIGAGGPQNQNYGYVKCEGKTGVDPAATVPEFHAITSDKFFEQNKKKFDIGFIDGLHLCEQVIKDIVNLWNCLNKGGWIVLHDCLPTSKDICTRIRTTVNWTGDAWKAPVWFRQTYPDVFCRVVNMDWGCGVIHKDRDDNIFFPSDEVVTSYVNLEWEWLQANLSLLNIVKELNELP